MSNVIDLNYYRRKKLEAQIFSAWRLRFPDTFSITTCLEDLCDETLYYLAHPGEWSNLAFYELIMSVLKMGPATSFIKLSSTDKMTVVEIHLFLADQVRLEMMTRLKWITKLGGKRHALVDLVQNASQIKAAFSQNPPCLAQSHPQYERFIKLDQKDRDGFIRRLLQDALKRFKKRL